jgi:hypothetical protein
MKDALSYIKGIPGSKLGKHKRRKGKTAMNIIDTTIIKLERSYEAAKRETDLVVAQILAERGI